MDTLFELDERENTVNAIDRVVREFVRNVGGGSHRSLKPHFPGLPDEMLAELVTSAADAYVHRPLSYRATLDRFVDLAEASMSSAPVA